MVARARKSIEEPVGNLPAIVEHAAKRSYGKRAPQFEKGNKAAKGRPLDIKGLYRESRRIGIAASPELMRGLVEMALHADDERVRSFCIVAALDRSGIRPIDAPEQDQDQRQRFNPEAYTLQELDLIEAGLRLLRQGRGDGPAEPEVIPPSRSASGGEDEPAA